MKRTVCAPLLALLLLGCDPKPQRSEPRVERLAKLCATHHEVPPRVLAALDDEDVRALRALARDESRPLWVRARAVALAGVKPTPATEELWSEMRRSPEEELRVQAAWAQGLARRDEQRLAFSRDLLRDDDVAVREAGAHLLASTGAEGAVAIARDRLAVEPNARVRAVLSRRVLKLEVSRAPPSGG